ncbi:MAG: DPP IV N-terminal domain-containing protein [Anaerolineae bacterium]
MSRFVLRVGLLLALLVSVAVALTNIIGRWIPYAGEIRYIVYGTRGQATPYTMDAGRGLSLRLLPSRTVIMMDWSAGNRYVFAAGEGTDIVSLENGTTHRVFNMRVSPLWSPDDLRLAFEGVDDYVDNEPSIYIANGDGTEVTLLLPDEAGDFRNPGFSPDGTQLIFNHDNDLYLYRFADERLLRLTATPDVTETLPRWSPDSQFIAFLWAETPQLNRLSVIDADGQNRFEVTTHIPGSPFSVVWSPDSRQLGFLMRVGGNLQAFVAARDNPTARQVGEPYPQTNVYLAGWAAGDVLVVNWAQRDIGHMTYYNDALDAAAGTLLQREETPSGLPVVSPDGQYILYLNDLLLLCIETRATAVQRCYSAGNVYPLSMRWLP